jgi:PAS domain S-box-containing protein
VSKKSNIANADTGLRHRAEAHLRDQRKGHESKAGDPEPEGGVQRQFHELQVHQVELEMQNDELRKSRDDLEAALAASTALYDFAPVGYFTLTESGAIIKANLTGAILVGVERSKLMGQPFGRLVTLELRPAFNAFLKQVFARQTKESSDFEILRQGQPHRIVNIQAQHWINGQECHIAVVDVTARKLAEADAARLAAIVNSSGDAIIGSDLNGVITNWNNGAERIFGYSAGEIVGCPIIRLIPSDRQQEDEQVMIRIMQGERVEHFDTVRVAKDGRQLDMSVTASPILSAAGKIVGVSRVGRDITERKRAEAERLRLNVLTASNRKLEQEIVRRKMVEQSLQKSEHDQSRLLAEMRLLSHRMLQVQEEERKRISRELHDIVAQTLVGMNSHLEVLTLKAAHKPRNLQPEITRTRRLLKKSLAIVHRFALELRPTVLDDLGLIPALHSFMKDFMKRTGVRARLKIFAEVERLPIAKRTVLYRVALEALNNAASHAQASRVEVSIKQLPDCICMKIKDDGQSFDVARVLRKKGDKRLGLLGMRERLEMIGGEFSIKSTPGRGTTVTAKISPGAVLRVGGGWR